LIVISLVRKTSLAAAFLGVCTLLAQQSTQSTPGQTQSAPQSTSSSQSLPDSPGTQINPGPQPTGATVLFDTSMGQMTCRLFDKQAPNAVANFIGLAEGKKEFTDPATKQKTRRPYYDGTTFHRVIPNFMIQGGDPLGTGEGDPGYMFKDEFDPTLNFDVPGRLAMANAGPDTNGSQFFITEVPATFLDQKYTIFGQCDDPTVDIVKAIARVNRDSNDKPLDPVVLKKVTIVSAGQPVPPAPSGVGASTPSTPPSTSPQPQF
jgi:peptidyl-prolyl cis-trans isomerase A (cyclophilin A)